MLYLMARSTAFDGDWIFDNDLARFGDPWNEPRTRTGRKSIVHPIGIPLVWTPLLWVAQAGAVIANVFGADVPLHGYSLWHQRFVFFSSVLAACATVLLGRLLARRFIGGAWAPTYAAVVVLLATPITYYATYMPSYSHALDAFACAGFLAYWALTLTRRDRRRMLILGLLLGVAMLIRAQELALGVVVAIEVAYEVMTRLRNRDVRDALRWLLFGAGTLATSLIVFAPQLVEWHLVFGSITELPQGARYTRFASPMITELLFSARNGWFATTPVAYLGFLGLFLVPKRARMIGGGLLAFLVLQVYLNSTVYDWWASSSFGQRRMCNVTIALTVGFATLLWRAGRLVAKLPRVPRALKHGLFVLLIGPFVAWNMSKAFALRGGKPAPMDLSPSCCHNVPAPFRGMATWIYNRIGNPFQFPANVVFAVGHSVDVRRWDRVVGNYPFVPPWNALTDEDLPKYHGTLHLGAGGSDALLAEGFSGSLKADREFRWTTQTEAVVLVPNLLPYGQRLSLWLAPGHATHAIVRWNGTVVATPELAGWTQVAFDLPDIELHTNELTVEAEIGPALPSNTWPMPSMWVGVAVSDLEFAFLPRL